MTEQIQPHGGILHDLILPPEQAIDYVDQLANMPTWILSHQQLCDVEMLMTGAFSPLNGFLSESDYKSVVESMRLRSGALWPIPVILAVTAAFAKRIGGEGLVALRDSEATLIAILQVTDIWEPDKQNEVKHVYGTTDQRHPGVNYVINHLGPIYLGGRLIGIRQPEHYDFRQIRHTPAELRAQFTKLGWQRIVAFQTRNPMHRAHWQLTENAMQSTQANLLLHPVDAAPPGDKDHYIRIRCYEAILPYYPKNTVILSVLPLVMRYAGPREALWHALIRQNYGCTHFIVGRHHAEASAPKKLGNWYEAYESQALIKQHQQELAIKLVPSEELVYVPEESTYLPLSRVTPEQTAQRLSATELRRRLADDQLIPDWFSFQEVIDELRKLYPAKKTQGFTVLITGLPASGKTTLAEALMAKFLELGNRSVTVLDGDRMRHLLSPDLGFSEKDRHQHLHRIGYVAREITKHRGIAICAVIAPYQDIRHYLREQISSEGGFIEVYLSTSSDVCQQRDKKGFYLQAKAGILKQFTGVNAPYEVPTHADVAIDTKDVTPLSAAQQVMMIIEKLGYSWR